MGKTVYRETIMLRQTVTLATAILYCYIFALYLYYCCVVGITTSMIKTASNSSRMSSSFAFYRKIYCCICRFSSQRHYELFSYHVFGWGSRWNTLKCLFLKLYTLIYRLHLHLVPKLSSSSEKLQLLLILSVCLTAFFCLTCCFKMDTVIFLPSNEAYVMVALDIASAADRIQRVAYNKSPLRGFEPRPFPSGLDNLVCLGDSYH